MASGRVSSQNYTRLPENFHFSCGRVQAFVMRDCTTVKFHHMLMSCGAFMKPLKKPSNCSVKRKINKLYGQPTQYPHPLQVMIYYKVLHCALSLAAQCIVIGPVCSGGRRVCVCVCGSVTTITRNCVH